ncbi:Phosphatidylglycerol phospholipase C [Colletotrichum spinosum]|uniref:Phosphatidylglycerol phospholipase C n=1 Tax=Colletotrichum spinosum TaxID=1347390 RepID=A0A4R8Q383_9PEZI|nr:Phosphatidylglycerol phospholipase C [Colletotrichum spinosum]
MASESKPLLAEELSAPFTRALPSSLPQTIAHRGYKALYPENTIPAFRAALDAGAHALETDLHLSKDGVVVLSHDGNLKRCFGVDKKISECEWGYLKGLKTLREPRAGLPRLRDLLEFLKEGGEGREGVWILLDIKTDDPAPELLGRVADVLASTPGPVPWERRIVLGCWNQPYLSHCQSLLPGYPRALISWSPLYARKFLPQPALSFNMFQKSLVGPLGSSFMRKLSAAGRGLFVWTVNDEEWMEWTLRAGGIDGVITDEVELFLDVCDRFQGGGAAASSDPKTRALADARRRQGAERGWKRTAKLYFEVAVLQALALLFTPLLMLLARFGIIGPGPKAAKAVAGGWGRLFGR